MVFSKITNNLFYDRTGGDSILKYINDNKVFYVMNDLYLLTNRCGSATVSINYLITRCGYSVNKQRQSDFKNILIKLKELNYINFNNNLKSYNDIIEIDTNNLNVDSEFFIAEAEEIELIKNNTSDKRECLNILKIYYYLKARVHKGVDIMKDGGRSQTTFNTYEDISKYTYISEANIKKYIDKLQDINLIKYTSLGYKYKANNKKLKTECANIYALTKISNECIDNDLKEGLKQQKYYYEKEGYIISKTGYINNNKKLNGLYGSLIKKEKNNKLTEEEKKVIEEIRMTM